MMRKRRGCYWASGLLLWTVCYGAAWAEVQVGGSAVLIGPQTFGSDQPQGITYHPATNSLFLVTKKPSKLWEVSLSGEVLKVVDISAVTGSPEGIAADPETGDLLVCKGTQSIYRFTTEGSVVGPAPMLVLSEPVNAKGIAVHPLTHHLFVADGNGHRVAEFNRNGTLVQSFNTGAFGITNPQGLGFRGTDLLVADDAGATHRIYLFTTEGVKLQEVLNSHSFGLKDPDGVVDIGQDRVCVAFDDDAALSCFQTPHDSFRLPYSTGLPSSFVGYTYLNTGSDSDYLNIQGISSSGGLAQFRQLGPFVAEGQDSRLTFQVFPNGLQSLEPAVPASSGDSDRQAFAVTPPAMLKFQSQNGSARGFFLTGDYNLNYQDGLGELPEPASSLYLPRAPVRPSISTVLFVLNSSSSETASVHFALHDPTGSELASVDRDLNPYGSLQTSLIQLFQYAGTLSDGYIRLTSSGASIQAFLLVVDDRNALIVSARPPAEERRFMVPHFYTGNRRESTVLRILNVDSRTATLTVNAFDSGGGSIASVAFDVAPNRLFTADVADLLQLPLPPSGVATPLSGYLEIDSHGPPFGPLFYSSHILGEATYIGVDRQTATSFAFLTKGSARTIYPYISQSIELGTRQGLVIYNPDSLPAQVTLRALDRDGIVTAEQSLSLAPRTRTVALLNEAPYFGPGFSQIGGHLEIIASRPIVSTAIIVGDRFLTMLSGQVAPNP